MIPADRTQLSPHRQSQLRLCALELLCVDGDVIEVGVWKGGSAKWLCQLFQGRTVYLFDTFQGMPETDTTIDGHKQGDFDDTSLESVQNYLADCPNAVIRAGVFPATAKGLEDKTFALAHIDCDLYSSTRDAIAFVWPRLNPGGIVVFDDYKSGQCAGATKAIDEFASQAGVTLTGNAPHEAAIVRKA
jgi:O-methyltransferase